MVLVGVHVLLFRTAPPALKMLFTHVQSATDTSEPTREQTKDVIELCIIDVSN